MSAIRSMDGTAIYDKDPGAPHGLCSTLEDTVNADLLASFKA